MENMMLQLKNTYQKIRINKKKRKKYVVANKYNEYSIFLAKRGPNFHNR